MRIIGAATLTLLPLAATAAQPQAQPPAAPPPPSAEAATPEKPLCDRFARVEHAGEGAVLQAPPARARRLDELPAGDLHLTVERVVDGCRERVIVRQGYGIVGRSPPAAASARPSLLRLRMTRVGQSPRSIAEARHHPLPPIGGGDRLGLMVEQAGEDQPAARRQRAGHRRARARSAARRGCWR